MIEPNYKVLCVLLFSLTVALTILMIAIFPHYYIPPEKVCNNYKKATYYELQSDNYFVGPFTKVLCIIKTEELKEDEQ